MSEIKTDPQIEKSWKKVLNDNFNSDYFKEIKNYIIQEKSKNHKIFPPENYIFNAFNHTPFKDVKVVIIGQDPYHGINQAHGLSFSVLEGNKHPPSLINIFKELETDLNIPYPKSGDLTPWADQGVLLLNASLTVREAEANSHQKIGWQKFTDNVIHLLSEQRENIVFLLWGGFAKKKGAKVDQTKHHILTSGHPSPLSANRGFWFGNQHFSKTNQILKELGKTEINWEIK
ncbi:MAG: uracil-DNA glycosylase [Flavobacteriales bacterium]|nr:MAG: uracil-DNA glycosylase [Flavobacteriales bacterium]